MPVDVQHGDLGQPVMKKMWRLYRARAVIDLSRLPKAVEIFGNVSRSGDATVAWNSLDVMPRHPSQNGKSRHRVKQSP